MTSHMNAIDWHRALAAAGLSVLALEVVHGAYATTVIIGIADDDDADGVWASAVSCGDEYRGVVARSGVPAHPIYGTASDVIAAIAATASRRTTLDKVHSQE